MFFSAVIRIAVWHLLLAGVCLYDLPSVAATQFYLKTSSGYDSNPAMDERSEGSGFTVHSVAGIHEFDLTHVFKATVSPSVAYQNLWEMEDNHQFNIEGAIASKTSNAGVLPYLFGSAYFHRDRLIESDERDEYTLGLGADWLALGRCTLTCEYAWKRINYLSGSVPFAHGSGKMINGGRNPAPGVQRPYPAADDVGMAATVILEMFILPSLKASAAIGLEGLESSVDMESYRQVTAGMNLTWDLAPSWQLMLDARGERRNYHEIQKEYGDIRKSNDKRCMETKLSRFWGNVEVFADFSMEQGEYPLHHESYYQREAQCGVSWSF